MPASMNMSHSAIDEAAGPLLQSVGRAAETPNRLTRLALVEDDDHFREAAILELEDLGFDVKGYADGDALLTALADGIEADVIVLDWNLPGLSGIDLIPRLRAPGSSSRWCC